MENRILAMVNQKEVNKTEGKTIKSVRTDDRNIMFYFEDGSTLEVESGVFENQILFCSTE